MTISGYHVVLCYNRTERSSDVTESPETLPDQTAPERVDPRLLTFKVCVAALWADGKMMAAERDQMSRLINSLAEDESERA